jgi:hypothetical protein
MTPNLQPQTARLEDPTSKNEPADNASQVLMELETLREIISQCNLRELLPLPPSMPEANAQRECEGRR